LTLENVEALAQNNELSLNVNGDGEKISFETLYQWQKRNQVVVKVAVGCKYSVLTKTCSPSGSISFTYTW